MDNESGFTLLPDFPKLKERLLRLAWFEHRSRIQADELIGPIRVVPYQEGRGFSSGDVEGHVERFEPKAMAFPFEIKRDAIIEHGVDAFRESLAKATAPQIQAMREMLLRRVAESSERVGNKIDAGGRPFSVEHYFQLLETVHIDFDELGHPEISGTRLVMHPDQAKHVRTLMEQWEKDEALQQRYRDIILKKREEWRDRESNRKLVD